MFVMVKPHQMIAGSGTESICLKNKTQMKSLKYSGPGTHTL
jgi:hypothetical protein